MASAPSGTDELISFDQTANIKRSEDVVIVNSHTRSGPLEDRYLSRNATENTVSAGFGIHGKSGVAPYTTSESGLNARLGDRDDFGNTSNDTSTKSGSLREYLSKQAMRRNVAEQLGIPDNSDVALQAVAEFERGINAKCAEEGVDDIDIELQDSSSRQNNDSRMLTDSPKSNIPDDFDMLLASTYVNEAFFGRHGFFVPERKQLRIYFWYNKVPVRVCLYLLIWTNMALVLFEEPAVKGWGLPYWVTMLIEMVCLVGYALRLYHAWAFMPSWRHWKDRKILIVLACLFVTLLDMVVYIVLKNTGYSKYAIRWSRVLRPAFIINFSESRQIRRAIRNIRRTLPEISNVLVLLLLMISLYALLGLKLFGKKKFVHT